jgi:hypothetical protein
MSEHLTTQEAQGANTLGMLHALGAAGQADGRIALHSVLAGGKRRITAELAHSSEQEGGQPVLQLQRVRRSKCYSYSCGCRLLSTARMQLQIKHR